MEHAMLTTLCWMAVLGAVAAQAQEQAPAATGWVLVRSVSDQQGGTLDFVLVPKQRQRDGPNYTVAGAAVCGVRQACLVHFWTDRGDVPTDAWMAGRALSQMTATYQRSPSHVAPVIRLACWLYATKAEAEGANCFYLPGAEVPWGR